MQYHFCKEHFLLGGTHHIFCIFHCIFTNTNSLYFYFIVQSNCHLGRVERVPLSQVMSDGGRLDRAWMQRPSFSECVVAGCYCPGLPSGSPGAAAPTAVFQPVLWLHTP